MIKTLDRSIKTGRVKFKVPRSVQDTIPIRRIWPDGIFQTGISYSKSWQFTDINYNIASEEDKKSMFWSYSDLLNALDSGISVKLTINNRRMDRAAYEKQLFLKFKEDGLNEYRQEYNDMLRAKIADSNNGIVQERYITTSAVKRNIQEARIYFARLGTEIITHFGQLSSKAVALDANERLEILRDFYKAGEPAAFPFDLGASMKQGRNFKDWISPTAIQFKDDFFEMDGHFGRVLYLQNYASYIKDEMIADLCSISAGMMLSIDILPVPTGEAVREIQSRLLGVETNVANWQRKQNANNNFSATIPYDLEQQRAETKEMLDDLTSRDQRLMFGLITVVLTADSKSQLDTDTESVLSAAGKDLCQMAALRYQQCDGLATVLPIGVRRIEALRTMNTESVAVMTPFHAQEIMQPGGIYYGQNIISKNMIVAGRQFLQNGNSYRLGVSGSGKSFSVKEEIAALVLGTDDDVLILDVEGEFTPFVRALGGEAIPCASTSPVRINAMDMDKDYGDERTPLAEKSAFILSMFEQVMGAEGVTAKEKSALDRCTAFACQDYIKRGFTGAPPTLKDLYRALLEQPEPEAQGLALAGELFISGTLNIFAEETNVNTNARLMSFDIRELGEQLMPVGMQVLLSYFLNRVTRNWREGRRTWIFADEFWLAMQHKYSSEFFYRLWKRVRKYNGFMCGMTQNVEVRPDRALCKAA